MFILSSGNILLMSSKIMINRLPNTLTEMQTYFSKIRFKRYFGFKRIVMVLFSLE
jgi:hypothetical protein